MSQSHQDVAAVVVDYHAGEALVACVDSLRVNGVASVVVVVNGEPDSLPDGLGNRAITLVTPELNLGYGRGVNRGAAAAPRTTYLLVSNPDVVLHEGAVAAMVRFLEANPRVGIAGPRIQRPDGTLYPSQRVFPNFWLAGAHALLAPLWPSNPATRRYRSVRPDGTLDWVSGACFLIRRDAFEAAGGFDERYFMFAEDMALCWRLREIGFAAAAVSDAVVTHIEGLSRQRASRAMVVAHHVSAMRFEWQTARGVRRALAPLALVVLAFRLFLVRALHVEL